jgi:hypothetical protein
MAKHKRQRTPENSALPLMPAGSMDCVIQSGVNRRPQRFAPKRFVHIPCGAQLN